MGSLVAGVNLGTPELALRSATPLGDLGFSSVGDDSGPGLALAFSLCRLRGNNHLPDAAMELAQKSGVVAWNVSEQHVCEESIGCIAAR